MESEKVFFAPGIRINHKDASQREGNAKAMLQDRKPLLQEPMYLEVSVKNHAPFPKNDRVIKMYVAEEHDICIPGNWRPLHSISQGREGGAAIPLGDVGAQQIAWTPQRFVYVRMSDKPYYLIAQITDVADMLNPLPTKTVIDPNELQMQRRWSFLYIKPHKPEN